MNENQSSLEYSTKLASTPILVMAKKDSTKRKKQEDENTNPSQLIQFFMLYSFQDVCRRKLLYLIAFTAVFVSILSILLIDVFVKKGSLIFVHMSEDLEIDA